jgi:hypothetical protein
MTDQGRTTPTPILPGADLLAVSRTADLAVLLNTHRQGWFMSEGTLARMKAGETPRPLLEHVLDADWYPDGQSLLVVRRSGGFCRLEEYPAGKVLYQTAGYVSYPRVTL